MITDPVERVIADALTAAGVAYVSSGDHKALDFYLPASDVYIECKRMHSPRIADQMSRHDNVIAVQGMASAKWLAAMIRPKRWWRIFGR
jgi:hypothetical protein